MTIDEKGAGINKMAYRIDDQAMIISGILLVPDNNGFGFDDISFKELLARSLVPTAMGCSLVPSKVTHHHAASSE